MSRIGGRRLGFSFPTEVVTEGQTKVVVPRLEAFVKEPCDYAPSKAPVFFNPVMELNRDLAVLALQAFQGIVRRELKVCEPLAGCGIRGIRMATEVDDVGSVVVNDINEDAFRLSEFNVEKNGLEGKVMVRNEDANFLLSGFAAPRKRFDFVDIDPFGSPVPFMDSALRATRRGGMLALTATDLAPLCGVHPKACVRRYGGKPLRTEYCHELAIRLLAGALATSAAKHDLSTTVVFSHSSEHYIRLYALVDYGARKADATLKNMGYILHCFSCFHREGAAKVAINSKTACPECSKKMNAAGPLWTGQIVNEDFVASMQRVAKTKSFRNKRIINKLLLLLREEAMAPITYYAVDKICDKLGLTVPPINRVVTKLREKRHETRLTHFSTHGIKTDALAKTVQETIIAEKPNSGTDIKTQKGPKVKLCERP